MGSSASKNKDPPKPKSGFSNMIDEAKEGRLRAKVSAMIKFNKHMTKITPTPGRNRKEVYSFLYSAKQENAKAWEEIQNGEAGAGYSMYDDGDEAAKPDLNISNEPHWKQVNALQLFYQLVFLYFRI